VFLPVNNTLGYPCAGGTLAQTFPLEDKGKVRKIIKTNTRNDFVALFFLFQLAEFIPLSVV